MPRQKMIDPFEMWLLRSMTQAEAAGYFGVSTPSISQAERRFGFTMARERSLKDYPADFQRGGLT